MTEEQLLKMDPPKSKEIDMNPERLILGNIKRMKEILKKENKVPTPIATGTEQAVVSPTSQPSAEALNAEITPSEDRESDIPAFLRKGIKLKGSYPAGQSVKEAVPQQKAPTAETLNVSVPAETPKVLQDFIKKVEDGEANDGDALKALNNVLGKELPKSVDLEDYLENIDLSLLDQPKLIVPFAEILKTNNRAFENPFDVFNILKDVDKEHVLELITKGKDMSANTLRAFYTYHLRNLFNEAFPNMQISPFINPEIFKSVLFLRYSNLCESDPASLVKNLWEMRRDTQSYYHNYIQADDLLRLALKNPKLAEQLRPLTNKLGDNFYAEDIMEEIAKTGVPPPSPETKQGAKVEPGKLPEVERSDNAHKAYREALVKYDPSAAANSREAFVAFENAFENSKLKKRDEFEGTPEGAVLWKKLIETGEIAGKAEAAFKLTDEGRRLWEENRSTAEKAGAALKKVLAAELAKIEQRKTEWLNEQYGEGNPQIERFKSNLQALGYIFEEATSTTETKAGQLILPAVIVRDGEGKPVFLKDGKERGFLMLDEANTALEEHLEVVRQAKAKAAAPPSAPDSVVEKTEEQKLREKLEALLQGLPSNRTSVPGEAATPATAVPAENLNVQASTGEQIDSLANVTPGQLDQMISDLPQGRKDEYDKEAGKILADAIVSGKTEKEQVDLLIQHQRTFLGKK